MVDLCKNNCMKSVKWTGVVGFILCGLCCLLPVIGVTAGIAALGSFVKHLETLGIALLAFSALLLVFHYVRKSKACKTCGNQCNCKGNTKAVQNEYL